MAILGWKESGKSGVSSPNNKCLRMATAGIAVFAMVVLPTASMGQLPGDRDPEFGNGGYVKINYGGAYDDLEGFAVAPDGKITGVGTGGSSNRFAVTRFLPNGELDTSFSVDGKLIIDLSGGSPCVQLLPDGKTLVGLPWYPEPRGFRVCRLMEDGSFDQTFGNGGHAVIVTGGSQPYPKALVLQPDGKILLAGYDYPWNWVIVRFNENGSADSTFGNEGLVVTNFGRPEISQPIDNLRTMVLLADGKILAGGSTSTTSAMSTGNRIYAMARYNPDGTLDTTYGDGGKYVFSYTPAGRSQSEHIYDMEFLPDGRILACGSGQSNQADFFRFNPDGTFDNSFGVDGRVVVDNIGLGCITIDALGRIIAAGGGRDPYGTWKMLIARFDSEGMLDPDFGVGGKSFDSFGMSSEGFYDIKMTPDGKILAGGRSGYANSVGNWLLARYINDPSVPACIGVNNLKLNQDVDHIDSIVMKGTYGPEEPIDLAADDVTLTINDDQGFEQVVSVPAGSFSQRGGGPNAARYVYNSPRGSVPYVKGKMDLAACTFEFTVSNLPNAIGMPASTVTATLEVGVNVGEETVALQSKGKSLIYRAQPAVTCCGQ